MKHLGYFRKKISVLVFVVMSVLMASATFGFFLNHVYFWGLIAIFPLGYLTIKTSLESPEYKRLMSLRSKWGVCETRETDLSQISEYFRKLAATREQKYVVDDRTWNDLDMDIIYGRLNQTLTIPGKQVLYALLRKPLFSQKSLEERSHFISQLLQDQDMKERIQVILSKLGKSGGKYFVGLLWDARPEPNEFLFLYYVVLLGNIEVLLDVSLKQDPLLLLQGLSRNKTVVAAWSGSIDGEHMVYATPDHPEYKRYPIRDFLIVNPEVAA
ncbi:MAG: BREX-3 system P-loop-containing protein BrxF [Candidatus Aminicenantales bacterium]